ncbi:MAG: TolC family protein [Pseudobacteriovorax sp.]|nr:TolC family protein [Pseudobacteriovorax sp.]
MQLYMENSQDIRLAKLQTQQENTELSLRQSTDSLVITAKPIYQSSFDGGENKSLLDSQMTQTFRNGSKLSLSYQKNSEKDGFGNNLSQQNFAVGLEQALGKNRFGRLLDLRVREGRSGLLMMQKEEELVEIQQCLYGAELYSKMFYQTKRLEIAKQLSLESEKILTFSKKNYRQQIIDEVTFLSAKANVIRSQSFLNLQQVAWDTLHNQIKILLQNQTIEMEEAPDLFLGSSFMAGSKPASIQEMILKQRIETNNIKKQILIESSKPQIDMAFEFGTNDYEGFAVDPGMNRYLQIGVKVSIPVSDPSLIHKKTALNISDESHRVNITKLGQNEEVFARKYLKELDFIETQLELSDEKITLYRSQIDIGYRQFLNNKIEFETYLDFQNRLLNEQLNHWDLKKSLWQLQLAAMSWNNSLPHFCVKG